VLIRDSCELLWPLVSVLNHDNEASRAADRAKDYRGASGSPSELRRDTSSSTNGKANRDGKDSLPHKNFRSCGLCSSTIRTPLARRKQNEMF
jgi:hypothetical protein